MPKNWSKEEVDILEDDWGTVSVPTIAIKLGRSLNSVRQKAIHLKLGRHVHASEFVTVHQLLVALGLGSSYGLCIKKMKEYNFPMRYKKSISEKFRVVSLDEFWEWMEKNKNVLSFAKFEKNMLGLEPDWANVKRKADFKSGTFNTTPWTLDEQRELTSMLKQYRYNYKDLSNHFNRKEGAIKKKILDMGLSMRPLKAMPALWTEEEVALTLDMRAKGYKAEAIAEALKTKTALAVKGKLERLDNPHWSARAWRDRDKSIEKKGGIIGTMLFRV